MDFLGYLHDHLTTQSLTDLAKENVSGWDTKFSVSLEISTGQIFKPMILTTTRFYSETEELNKQTRLTTLAERNPLEIVVDTSVPLAILGLSPVELKENCRKHIEEMVKNPEYSAHCTADDPSNLPRCILDIVQEYCNKRDVSFHIYNTTLSVANGSIDATPARRNEASCYPLLHGGASNILPEIHTRTPSSGDDRGSRNVSCKPTSQSPDKGLDA